MSDNVTEIDRFVFENCVNLSDITIPNNVTEICESTFSNCIKLNNIVIPDIVTEIHESAFKGCENLKKITIPKKVEKIDTNAFYGCTRLADVYYTGTRAEWGNISIERRNTPLTDATIHFSSGPTTEPTPLPMTTYDIDAAAFDDFYKFELKIENAALYENCNVYIARYNENKMLIGLDKELLNSTGEQEFQVNKDTNIKSIKIFILSPNIQPVIESKEFQAADII